jgi:hypothetical protein
LEENKLQVMQRLKLSFCFVVKQQKDSGVQDPTIQDRLQYKALTRAFFLLTAKLEKKE